MHFSNTSLYVNNIVCVNFRYPLYEETKTTSSSIYSLACAIDFTVFPFYFFGIKATIKTKFHV